MIVKHPTYTQIYGRALG